MLEKLLVKKLLSYGNIVKLMSKKVDLNTLTYRNQGVLLLCIKHDMKEEAGLLIKNGIDLDIQYEKGKTVLHLALEWGKYDMAEMLIKNGANVNIVDAQNKTPIHYATMADNLEMVDLLIKKGSDVDSRDMFGETPIFKALINEKNNVIECLIENSKILKVTSTLGMTPLHVAVSTKNEKAVKKLINQGIDVDMLDESGQTALIYAVKKGYTKIAKMLIEQGANVNIEHVTSNHLRLIDVACCRGYVDMVELLLDNNSVITEKLIEWAYHREEEGIIRKINILNGTDDDKKRHSKIKVDRLLKRGKSIADIKKFAVDNNKSEMLKAVLKIDKGRYTYKNEKNNDGKLIYTAIKNHNEHMAKVLMYNLSKDSAKALDCLLNNVGINELVKRKYKSDARENIRKTKIDIERQCILDCVYQSKRVNLPKTITK